MKRIACLTVGLAAAGLTVCPALADEAFDRDRAVILERFRAEGTDSTEFLQTLREDGTWPDIDYNNQSHGWWRPSDHLKRTVAFARVRPDAAVRALAAWVRLKPRSPNWWHNCIGAPMYLTDIMIRVRMENLPEDLRGKLRPLLFERPNFKMTGQNYVWTEGIRVKEGLLYGDRAMIRTALDNVMREVRVVPPGEEGLQRDASYHQHGTQLQFGNYGLSFFIEQARWAKILRGTGFAYPEEKIALLENFLMNGLRWTMWDQLMDFSACGRHLHRDDAAKKYRSVLFGARELAPCLPEARREAIRAWLADPAALTGARAFPNSGYLAYFSPGGWRFSVKMDSAKLAGSETCNSENMRGKYQGDGAAFFGALSRYEGYPALMDARLIPGTTEIQDDRSLVPNNFRIEYRNQNGFYAVWADFPVAVAAMRLDTGDLTADKVYFCTASGVTYAGSDIRSASASPVVTCIDQYREDSEAKFPVVCDVPAGFPPVVRTAALRESNWKDFFFEARSVPVSGRVVTLTIDHGVKPDGARYFCRLRKKDVPAGEETRLATSSPRIHALTAAGRALVAAFVPGTVTLADGKEISVKPGITVLDPAGGVLARAEFRER